MLGMLSRNNRLLMLALFVWALGEGLWYINFRQLYLVQLGATEAQVGLALAIELAVRALLPIPAGYLADRIGPHRVMVASWFLGVLGTVMCALATTWQGFIPGLVVYGISAFAMPSLSAYAIQNMPPGSARAGQTDRVLAAVFAAYTAGLIVSPALGGLVAESWGIRTGLWISTGVFALSTAIVLLTTEVEVTAPPTSERPADLLRNRRFQRLSLYYALIFVAMFTGYQLLPNFLQEARGLTLGYIGLLFSIDALGTVVLNTVASRLNPRWSLAAALGVYTLALLGIWLFAQPALLAVTFFGVGALAVVRTLALARAADVVSARNQGLAFGIVETAYAVAAAIAAAAAGQLYELTPAHDLPLVVALVALPVLIGLWFVVRRQIPALALPDEPHALAAAPEQAGR
ncbi:MAG: MFS transporter [Aggregatilineales bacterium]|nr:MFS transporter [Chloroflexota bacterium]HOA23090.1 MFS transporter [Aggregatilineales bacterium]HPV06710.1 MFS transporter [Aggregatilineales bacterium]HQE17166.1 MFS transporter [Aggregatilineales bacterium]